MADNAMLYTDDIHHCNPEFLQKFIILAMDSVRWKTSTTAIPKTYNFRSKRFCLVMAGNPCSESGDVFRIPDMLANRADIYNLVDIAGQNNRLFEPSLI